MANKQTVYIISAKRTPLGAFMGALSSVPAPKLAASTIESCLKESGISPSSVDQVILGCVLSAGIGQAPARQAVIYSGLGSSVPATTINKVCGSGLKSIALGAQSILTGESDVCVVGGMENMSLAPHYLESMRSGFRMGHQKFTDGMIKDGLWDPYNDFHMGMAAEKCVSKYSFTREEQDAYAIESFKRAQNAQKENAFTAEIAPVVITGKKGDKVEVSVDEGPGKAQFDKMAKLSPAFKKDGSITAANASTINDGAAVLILASEDAVKKLQLKPIAKIVGYTSHAQEPEWFTTAPVGAMNKLFSQNQWSVDSVDLFEVNEAFAVVAMAAAKELKIPSQKLNINGGAVSLGHPIGASGARIVVTLIHALRSRKLKRGVASICIGGGEGLAMGVEVI